MDNANAYQTKNDIQRQIDYRHAQMDKNSKNRWPLMKS